MSLKEFKRLEEYWALLENVKEECPMCGQLMTSYNSKYVDGVEVRFCDNCHELEQSISVSSNHKNICPSCHQIIRFEEEDEDENNHIVCKVEGCEHKAHLDCVEDSICDKCSIWVCEDHRTKYMKCDHCECFHEESCFISLSSDFIDEFGYICGTCYRLAIIWDNNI